MADPPLPPGFTVDQSAQPGHPPLPPGFTIDGEDQPPAAPPGQKFVGWGIDTGDNNRRYPMFGPDDTTKKIDALPASSRPGITDKIVHGMTMGLDTEAAGLAEGLGSAIAHPIQAWQSGGQSVADAYSQGRQDNIDRLNYVDQHHPIAGTAADIGGMLMSPIGAVSAGTGMLGLAKSGATIGGLAGFEQGNGPITQRAENGTIGAGTGAVAAPLVGHFAGGVAGLVGDAVGAVRNRGVATGAELVAKKLGEDNLTPADAAAAMQSGQSNGTPTVLADMGENTRALAGSVSRQPGAARNVAKTVTADRQLGQGERIKDAINRDLGHTTDTYEESERLIKGAQTAAKPLYEKFYQRPALSSPKLERLLGTPAGRQAANRAMTIAANEGRDPAALGFSLDGAGNVSVHPVQVDLHGSLAAARSEFDAAQAEMASAKRAVLGGGGTSRVAAAQERLRSAQEALQEASGNLKAAPSAGTAKSQRGYTPQTIDYIKRGLDDVLQAQPRHPASGKIILDEGTRAIEGVRKAFVAEADRLHPGIYSAARKAYAGPAQLRDAMLEGQKALNKSAAEINQRLKNMTPPEHEQYALGLRSAIADKLEAGADNSNKVRQLVANPKKRAALQRVFGGKSNLERFLSTLDTEQKAFETYSAIHRGSPTAERMAEDASNHGKLFTGLVRDGAEVVGGGHLGIASVGIRRAGEAIKFGVGKAGQRAREDAASLLFSSDPREFTNAMAQRDLRIAARNNRHNALVSGARSAGGKIAATGGAVTTNALLGRQPPK